MIPGQFNPGQVAMGGGRTGPYMGSTPPQPNQPPSAQPHPPFPAPPRPQQPQQPSAQQQGVLGASPVRATGSGPFDPAYRQNLATYAMGQFAPPPPQQGWQINPTNPGNIGQPTGGGNAPVFGQPNTLLGNALGGQGFSWAPPQAAAQQPSSPYQNLPYGPPSWLDYFLGQGGQGGGRRQMTGQG